MSLPESQSQPVQLPSHLESVTESVCDPTPHPNSSTQSGLLPLMLMTSGIALVMSLLLFGVGASLSQIVAVPLCILRWFSPIAIPV
jgi:hypothetical protein